MIHLLTNLMSATIETKKSTNHVAWSDDGNHEFIVIDDQVYKAAIAADFDLNSDNRVGTWECTVTMGKQHPDVYPFLQEQPVMSSWQERVYNAPVASKKQATLFKSVYGNYVSID